jgi:radical SAM enzyme (TIGR01210 family)
MGRRRLGPPPVCSPRTRHAIVAISTPSTPDAQIRRLRPPKPVVDPWKAHGTVVEEERSPNGGLERTLTVFLAGAECPFACSFCDLWRWTLDGPTPQGALPTQLERVLDELAPPVPDRLKLYNASNFFDRRAVPAEDLPRIAGLAAPFAAVTVESHANTIGPLTLEFAALLTGRLEVAVGLETIHPVAAAHLNKKLDLHRFDRAAAFLVEHDIDLRGFALLGAPYVPAEQSIEWTVRTVEYAAVHGASRIAVIPVRGGNGEMERLEALGHFVPPTLVQLETVVEHCLALTPAIVSADLWDVERLPACEACRSERVARLRQLNLSGREQPAPPAPPVSCSVCA